MSGFGPCRKLPLYTIEKFASTAWANLFFSPLSFMSLRARDISGEGAQAREKNTYAKV